MLRARSIPYKRILHANTVPIVQKQFKPYRGGKVVICDLCSHRIAQHSIVFYEDLPYAIAMLKQGKSESTVNELIWQKAVREQHGSIYRAHSTLSVCNPCVAKQLYEETRNADTARSYFDAVGVNDNCSLVIGRFTDRPYHPALFYTVAPNIQDFLASLNADSLRSNVRQCDLAMKQGVVRAASVHHG